MRKYIKPELDIVEFDNLDVIMVSNPQGNDPNASSGQALVENDSPIAVHNEEQLLNSTPIANNAAPTTAPEATAEPTDTPLTTETPAAEPVQETPAEESAVTTDEVAPQAAEADASGDIIVE